MTPALVLEGLWARRGTVRVLEDLDLTVPEGKVVALLGRSGSGKSTIVRLLLGLCAPDQGIIRIGNTVVSEAGEVRVPPEARDIAVVFQGLGLWPHLTVEGNLRFVLRSRGRPRRRKEEADRIHTILQQVGLDGLAPRHPGQLSGGEQQRLAIARALVVDPTAVLLDEPLANLDVMTKQELLALLRDLLGERRVTALYVTHDPREASALTSDVAILEDRHVTYAGSLREVPDTSTFTRAVRAALHE